eukprot:3698007-Pyramimonas_sp.AAC.1
MLAALASVFLQCERALVWPSKRLVIGLVRLPKPDGGHRLVAILDALLRVWGRIRRSITESGRRVVVLGSLGGLGR